MSLLVLGIAAFLSQVTLSHARCTAAVILKIHGIYMIRNWFTNWKVGFVIYGQPTTTVITTRSLFVTPVYANGFLSSGIG